MPSPRLNSNPSNSKASWGIAKSASFGWRYDFNDSSLKRAAEIPAFLHPVRERAAEAAGVVPAVIEQAMVTEYSPGAAIGWHRDPLNLRRGHRHFTGLAVHIPVSAKDRREVGSRFDNPGSALAYRLNGPARTDWEHSIAAVTTLRYSITFRTMKSKASYGARGIRETAEPRLVEGGRGS